MKALVSAVRRAILSLCIQGLALVQGCSKQWIIDCLHWRGHVLTGRFRHYCYDWDGLREWPCGCNFSPTESP